MRTCVKWSIMFSSSFCCAFCAPNMDGICLRMCPISSMWILQARTRFTNSLILRSQLCVKKRRWPGRRGRRRARSQGRSKAGSRAGTQAGKVREAVSAVSATAAIRKVLSVSPRPTCPPTNAAYAALLLLPSPPLLLLLCPTSHQPRAAHPPTCAVGTHTATPAAPSAPPRTAPWQTGSCPAATYQGETRSRLPYQLETVGNETLYCTGCTSPTAHLPHTWHRDLPDTPLK